MEHVDTFNPQDWQATDGSFAHEIANYWNNNFSTPIPMMVDDPMMEKKMEQPPLNQESKVLKRKHSLDILFELLEKETTEIKQTRKKITKKHSLDLLFDLFEKKKDDVNVNGFRSYGNSLDEYDSELVMSQLYGIKEETLNDLDQVFMEEESMSHCGA